VCETAPTHVVDLLTALPKNGPLRPADIAATNRLRIEGTANLLQAAIAAGAKRIVGESFVGVYGYGDLGARPLSDTWLNQALKQTGHATNDSSSSGAFSPMSWLRFFPIQ